jgi:hypothetical protein
MAELGECRLDDRQVHEASTLISAALRATLGNDEQKADAVWRQICASDDHSDLPPAFRREVGEVLRSLASSAPAFDALWHIKRVREHADARHEQNKPALREALQAVDVLIAQGAVSPDDGHGWRAVAERASSRRQELLRTRIGGREDGDVLAWMTLMHAAHRLSGSSTPPADTLLAASMAWSNGFTSSGPGTDFNRVLHRMHKFRTWVARAGDKPSIGRFVLRVLGRQRSPLLAMRHGLLGGDLGDIPTEGRIYRERTHRALETLRTAMQLTIDAQPDSGPMSATVTTRHLRKALIDHWVGLGDELQRGARLTPAERLGLLERLRDNDPRMQRISKRAASAILGTAFTLDVLEHWAASPDLAAHLDHEAWAEQLGDARRTATPGLSPAIDPGEPTQLHDVALRALETEGVQFRHGGKLGLEPVVNVAIVTGPPEIYGAGGSIARERGRFAMVRIGTSTIGSDIYLGTESRSSSRIAAFAYGGVNFFRRFVVGASARISYQEEHGSATGVSLRVSKTIGDHKAQARRVIDFFFEPSSQTTDEPDDGPATWQRFACQFFDSDVSVNFVRAVNSSRTAGVAIGGAAGGSAFQQSMALRVGAGYEAKWASALRLETAGKTASDTVGMRQTNALSAHVGLGWNPIPSVALDGTTQADSIGITPIPIIRYQAKFNTPHGSSAQVRLTTDHDRIRGPLSLQQREFRSCEELIAQLQERRAIWEAALGGPRSFDVAIDGLRAIAFSSRDDSGDRWYTERLQLTPDAADALTLIQAQKTLEGRNPQADVAEQSRLNDAFGQVLGDPTNWAPEKLAAFEVVSEAASVGSEYVLIASTLTEATSVTRYLYQAKATAPDNTGSAVDTQAAVQAETPDTVPHGQILTVEPDLREWLSRSNAGEDENVFMSIRRLRSVLYGMLAGERKDDILRLRRALLEALRTNDEPAPYAQALVVANALREAGVQTVFGGLQVLANLKLGVLNGESSVQQSTVAVRSILRLRSVLYGMLVGQRKDDMLRLRRALLEALRTNDEPAPYAQALVVANALREAGVQTAFDGLQVLANLKLGVLSGESPVRQSTIAVDKALDTNGPGRAALVRLRSPRS